jgi:hypothetical protein
MKTLKLISLILTLSITGYSQSGKSGQAVNAPDSVVLGQGYANDIYYSLESGVVATVPRTNWDIGFHTTVWTAGIITNGAAGVLLYTYPKADTAGWNTVDTAGIAGWNVLYDSEDDWEDGAFNRNASGHPDYGWGKYNPINHDVVGDSIYILKTLDGIYRKVWIIRKNSSNNIYFIRNANLDGSNDKVVELDINPYRNVNFVYYSFSSASLLEREPDTASWDVLFTKYMAVQPDSSLYPVVGVIDNFKVYAGEFYPVEPDFSDWSSAPLDSTKSPVGWEWKSFDMDKFTWTVADSTTFFIHSWNRDIYKLIFTKFEGSSTGKIIFDKEAVSPSGIFSIKPGQAEISVYPNPVKDQLNIVLGDEIRGTVMVSVFDMTGKLVFNSRQEVSGNTLPLKLPASTVCNGLHLLKVQAGNEIFTSKFLVTNY